MQKFSDIILSQDGRPKAGLRIVVDPYVDGAAMNLSATSGATIYAIDGGPAVPSVLTDADGRFSFYAADGRYSLTVTGTGVVPYQLTDVTLNDVDETEVNVRNAPFNAKGNGVTDNSSILASMIAALGSGAAAAEILFPPGDYLIASSITISANVALRFRAGARLVIPDGVTVTLEEIDLLAGRQQIFACSGTGKVVGIVRNDVIYPEWWGAVADGLNPNNGTDFSARAAAAARNTAPLQAALDFAGSLYSTTLGRNGTVSLTYGFYIHSQPLRVPLSVNMIGYGIGSALFYYAPTGNAVEVVDTNNSLLSDFFIAPLAGPTWNYTTGYGLYMKGVSTPCVRNVWSSSFGAGTFYFESVIEGRINGLISDNSIGPAFVIRGVGRGTVLDTCVTAGTKGVCFDIQNCYDWVLTGCTAKDGAGGTNGFYMNGCENVNLIGCAAYDINRDAYLLTGTTLSCNLTNCMAYAPSQLTAGAYSGFQISGTRNKLVGCKVIANTPAYNYGITFGGAATDCTTIAHNITPGTLGSVLDQQPIGTNTYPIHKVSTTTAIPLTIWSKSINNNAGAFIKAIVTAKQRGATGATACYEFWAYVRTNTTATALLAGPTSTASYESDAGLNATFVLTDATANAGIVALQVTGLTTGLTVDWEATVTVSSVTG